MNPSPLEVFFDGACPFCVREMRFLRRKDRQERILFTDIASPSFDAQTYGKPMAVFMARIQARLPDGSWLEGVEVFRALYEAIGYRRLVAVSRWPGIAGLLDIGYRLFARNRLRLSGRCTPETCSHGAA